MMKVYLFILVFMVTLSTESYAFKFSWPGAKNQAAKQAEELYFSANRAYGSADYAKAIEITTKAIKLDPTYAKTYMLRGKAKKDMGEIDKAFGDLDKAIELDPKLGEAYFIRAQVNEIMGEMKKADADYKKGCKFGFSLACS